MTAFSTPESSKPKLNKFGGDNKRKKRISQHQEANTATRLGGTVQPGSGCSWKAKGDVKTDQFLVEAKITESASYRLTIETWKKISKEALAAGKIPMMRIDLAGSDESLVVLRMTDFIGL